MKKDLLWRWPEKEISQQQDEKIDRFDRSKKGRGKGAEGIYENHMGLVALKRNDMKSGQSGGILFQNG